MDGHHYSVPFRLVREEMKVRLTATTVEAFHDGRRIAAHVRGRRKGGFTTDPSHRPKAHREHLAWPPSRLIHWAEQTGPHTAGIVRRLLEERPHPEQGYRPCLGIIRRGNRCMRIPTKWPTQSEGSGPPVPREVAQGRRGDRSVATLVWTQGVSG